MPAPRLPIRIGVIGLSTSGGWAITLLAPILGPDAPLASAYKLTAILTRSAETAAATAAKYSTELGHTVKGYHGPDGARALVNDPDVDLVVVTVKVADHRANTVLALEAGKDVFVEWPLGRGFAEGRELAELARKKGVRTMVGTQATQAPFVRKLREIVRSGELGKIVSTSLSAIMPSVMPHGGGAVPEQYAYIAEPDSGASTTESPAAHILAALLWALGDAASVSAHFVPSASPRRALVGSDGAPTGRFVDWPHEEQVAVCGVLAGGATLTVHVRGGLPAGARGRVPFEWLVDGTAGSVEVRADTPLISMQAPQSVRIKGAPWTPERGESVDRAASVGAEWGHFANAGLFEILESQWREFAKGEEGEYATFEDGYRLHRFVEAIRRSAREGVRVSIAD